MLFVELINLNNVQVCLHNDIHHITSSWEIGLGLGLRRGHIVGEFP